MKKFIVNIVLFSSILISFFYLFDKIISSGLQKSKGTRYNNLTKLFNGKINADIIINGASSAYVEVSPQIIDSILNLNSYNLALDATPFVPQKMQFDLYIKHNKIPKTVIQIVDMNSLKEAGGELYNYVKFAPYLDIEVVQKTTKLYDGFSSYDYVFPLIKYSGKPIEVIDGVMSLFNVNIESSDLYKGYLEQNKSWDGSFEKFKKNYHRKIIPKLDSTTCKLFEDYVVECKKMNIDLIIVYAPVYHELNPFDLKRSQNFEFYNKISKKYNVPFYDFYNDKQLSFDKQYFFNSQHLNKSGTKIFTSKISNLIKDRVH